MRGEASVARVERGLSAHEDWKTRHDCVIDETVVA